MKKHPTISRLMRNMHIVLFGITVGAKQSKNSLSVYTADRGRYSIDYSGVNGGERSLRIQI